LAKALLYPLTAAYNLGSFQDDKFILVPFYRPAATIAALAAVAARPANKLVFSLFA